MNTGITETLYFTQIYMGSRDSNLCPPAYMTSALSTLNKRKKTLLDGASQDIKYYVLLFCSIHTTSRCNILDLDL